MRVMFELVNKCAEPMMQLFETYSQSGDPMDIKDIVAMFATDVIGCVAFGLDAGFGTSSTTMHYALYELARNPDLQEKTRVEIETVLKKHGGHLTYESFQDMTYLRQVIDGKRFGLMQSSIGLIKVLKT
ncbi:hypothetical protein YQE_04800, partial [Dendroctonus ponderosae]